MTVANSNGMSRPSSPLLLLLLLTVARSTSSSTSANLRSDLTAVWKALGWRRMALVLKDDEAGTLRAATDCNVSLTLIPSSHYLSAFDNGTLKFQFDNGAPYVTFLGVKNNALNIAHFLGLYRRPFSMMVAVLTDEEEENLAELLDEHVCNKTSTGFYRVILGQGQVNVCSS